MVITITDHAFKRAKERLNINSKALKRIINKIYNNGISHSSTHGRLNKYLTKLFFIHQTANNIKIYGNTVYIFHNKVLITLHRVPNNLLKCLR